MQRDKSDASVTSSDGQFAEKADAATAADTDIEAQKVGAFYKHKTHLVANMVQG